MNLELLTQAKSLGFSDRQIAHLTGQTEDAVRAELLSCGHLRCFVRFQIGEATA